MFAPTRRLHYNIGPADSLGVAIRYSATRIDSYVTIGRAVLYNIQV